MTTVKTDYGTWLYLPPGWTKPPTTVNEALRAARDVLD